MVIIQNYYLTKTFSPEVHFYREGHYFPVYMAGVYSVCILEKKSVLDIRTCFAHALRSARFTSYLKGIYNRCIQAMGERQRRNARLRTHSIFEERKRDRFPLKIRERERGTRS